jgi:hypothetical protein
MLYYPICSTLHVRYMLFMKFTHRPCLTIRTYLDTWRPWNLSHYKGFEDHLNSHSVPASRMAVIWYGPNTHTERSGWSYGERTRSITIGRGSYTAETASPLYAHCPSPGKTTLYFGASFGILTSARLTEPTNYTDSESSK